MKPITVFYADRLYGEYDRYSDPGYAEARSNSEIYNGAYLLIRITNGDRAWYRMDLTPVLLEDIPPSIRALALLLS